VDQPQVYLDQATALWNRYHGLVRHGFTPTRNSLTDQQEATIEASHSSSLTDHKVPP
jgi:hypothetical protein